MTLTCVLTKSRKQCSKRRKCSDALKVRSEIKSYWLKQNTSLRVLTCCTSLPWDKSECVKGNQICVTYNISTDCAITFLHWLCNIIKCGTSPRNVRFTVDLCLQWLWPLTSDPKNKWGTSSHNEEHVCHILISSVTRFK